MNLVPSVDKTMSQKVGPSRVDEDFSSRMRPTLKEMWYSSESLIRSLQLAVRRISISFPTGRSC